MLCLKWEEEEAEEERVEEEVVRKALTTFRPTVTTVSFLRKRDCNIYSTQLSLIYDVTLNLLLLTDDKMEEEGVVSEEGIQRNEQKRSRGRATKRCKNRKVAKKTKILGVPEI
jgi:hypothetical protein